MATRTLAVQLENIDQRLNRVEQILPTLATKDDLVATKGELRREIDRAIEPLATKEELRREIDRAVEPLATREELRREIDRAVEPLATNEKLRREIERAVEPLATNEELRREIVHAIEPLATKEALHELREELRRHIDVSREALQSSIDLLAEHLVRIATKVYGR
jgi:hypothetical protein